MGLSSLRQLSILNLKLSYQSRAEGQPRTNLLRGPNFPFSSCRRQAADISHLSRAKGHLDSFPPFCPAAQCLVRMLRAEDNPAELQCLRLSLVFLKGRRERSKPYQALGGKFDCKTSSISQPQIPLSNLGCQKEYSQTPKLTAREGSYPWVLV